jgi:hypothetical protein
MADSNFSPNRQFSAESIHTDTISMEKFTP